MDEAWEIEMGTKLYPIYTQENLGLFPDPELQQYLHQVGISLANHSHRPKLPYEYNGINQPVINAYALPGGKISITRPLLGKMETEAQLAFVLGHETAHVNLRHAARGYSHALLTQLLFLGGMVVLETQEVKHREYYLLAGLFGSQLLLLHYSREQEREADHWGYVYMTRAGYAPQGMVEALNILYQAEGRHPTKLENFFQTHPLTRERIEEAKKWVASYSGEAQGVFRDRFKKATLKLKQSQPGYALFDKGYFALADGKVKEALSYFQQAEKKLPTHGIVYALEGYAYYTTKKLHQAEVKGLRAVELAPELFWGHFVLGQVYTTQKKYRKALKHLEKADKLYPERVDTYFLLGVSHEGLGNWEEARKYFTFVVQHGTGELQQKAQKHLNRL